RRNGNAHARLRTRYTPYREPPTGDARRGGFRGPNRRAHGVRMVACAPRAPTTAARDQLRLRTFAHRRHRSDDRARRARAVPRAYHSRARLIEPASPKARRAAHPARIAVGRL